MGKFVFGMMQSLDGYVAGVAGGPGSDGYVAGLASGLELPPPGVSLNRHFNDHVRGLAGLLCGRRMYEVMRYWDEDQPDWEVAEHDFAALWRAKPKWVVSRSLKSVGANDARGGRRRSVRAPAEGGSRGRNRRRRARTRGLPHRPRSHRRVSSLLPPVCARSRQAVLRRCQAAPPTYRRRSRRRGCG